MNGLSACLLVTIAAILFTPAVAEASEGRAVDVAPIGPVIRPEWSDLGTLVSTDNILGIAFTVLWEASEAGRADIAEVMDAVSQVNNEKGRFARLRLVLP